MARIRKQLIRLAIVAAILLSHFAVFLGGYYYGRSENIADHQHQDWNLGGWWETQGLTE